MFRAFFSSALFFTVTLLHSSSGFAATTKEIADSLTLLSNQPSFQEMIDAFGGKFPDENPFQIEGNIVKPEINLNGFSGLTQAPNAAAELARYIAKIELIYPGATWAFLGNDTRLPADAVEAFYLSIGQRDRVVPLMGSGTTIRIQNMKLLAKFLDSGGFDAKNPLSRAPFIIIDGTGYQQSSQIRHLLKAGYQAYAKNGGEPVNLLTKLNALRFGNDSVDNSGNLEFRDRYFEVQRTHLAEANNPFSTAIYDGIPSGILAVSLLHTLRRNLWHNGYGPIVQDEKGRWIGSTLTEGRWIGSTLTETDATHKRHILIYLYDLYQAISEPKLLQLVQETARNLGYEFPLQRPAVGKVYKPKLTPISKETTALQFNFLETVVRKLDRSYMLRHRQPGAELNQNAKNILDWLHTNAKGKYLDEILIMFLRQVSSLMNSNIISADDLRDFVVAAIGLYNPKSVEFELQLRTLIETNIHLQNLFTNPYGRQAAWLKELSQTDTVIGPKVARIFERVVLSLECERGLVS